MRDVARGIGRTEPIGEAVRYQISASLPLPRHPQPLIDMTEPREPAERDQRSPLPWIIAVLLGAILLVFGLTQWLDTGEDETPTTTAAGETTLAPTTAPPPTTAPTTAPPTTSPTDTATTPPTTVAPTTTGTSIDASGLPERAITQTGGDIVWMDPLTAETEVAHPGMFEAAWAESTALSPDQSRLYYHRMSEDFWFSCESAQGEVVILDMGTGAAETVDRGRPTLSPDGQRLAYLTAEECYPDPDEPEFFLTAYDTLVIADADGNELGRLPAGGEGEPLSHLVWEDDQTLLVTDRGGSHHRVPADVPEGTSVRDQEKLDLPGLVLYAVVDGTGLGAEHEPDRLPGRLLAVDLGSGDATPVEIDTLGPYAVGVSAEGDVLVGAQRSQGDHVLLVDVDPQTARVAGVVNSPPLSGLDW